MLAIAASSADIASSTAATAATPPAAWLPTVLAPFAAPVAAAWMTASSRVSTTLAGSLAVRRARLAPASVVQRAAFSSMLRSVSCTLAAGAADCADDPADALARE
ncbi:hypothetical protein [Paraburkholderia bengalensis]|uniref:hypothetical protein n=1 Tax=Paraburkholderia bengalensis TaxID=2747562 RepID=UPI003014D9F8